LLEDRGAVDCAITKLEARIDNEFNLSEIDSENTNSERRVTERKDLYSSQRVGYNQLRNEKDQLSKLNQNYQETVRFLEVKTDQRGKENSKLQDQISYSDALLASETMKRKLIEEVSLQPAEQTFSFKVRHSYPW